MAAPPTANVIGTPGGLAPDRRGALLYVVASLVFICTDSLAKVMVSDMPVIPVILGRNIAYVAAVVVILGGRSPARLLRTSRPRTQVVRGLLMFASTASYFWALSLLPLAEVSTLSSTAPLITIALAGPLLGEHVTRSAVVGAVVGFGGVVLLVGGEQARLDVAVIVPLANAAILAFFYLLTRDLRDESASVTLFWSGAIPLAASLMLFAAVPSGPAPAPIEWLGVAGVGLLALTAHGLLVAAYRWARASDLAPMGYLSVLWAFVVGAIVFSEPISTQSALGAMAIVMGGVIALRESAGGDAGTQAMPEYPVPVSDAPSDASVDTAVIAPVPSDR
jgi:drug/metabolite transporter (DMT)-like permease